MQRPVKRVARSKVRLDLDLALTGLALLPIIARGRRKRNASRPKLKPKPRWGIRWKHDRESGLQALKQICGKRRQNKGRSRDLGRSA